jgi:dTDP-glucose 4,6-dehydratase
MKLLVTGGLGFIGSNFILKLLKESNDFEIINVDAELHGADKTNLSEIQNNKKYEFVKGNITNKRLMEELILKCDAVVNFAAESFVDRSIDNADPFLVSNIRGSFTILDIITKQKKRMVQISTDEVFGSLSTGTATEKSQLNPSNPYAATKAAAELLIKSYVSTHNSDVIVTRCTNNYGPRQFPEKLIPKIIILANQLNNIPIYGQGLNIRDWIHVDDHCNAVLMALLDGKTGESYNVSANNEVDNLTIVHKILKLMNKPDDLIKFVEDRPGHDLRYSMDSKKISNELGWKIKTSFDDGLQNTINWYLNNPEILNKIHLETVQDSTPWKNSN